MKKLRAQIDAIDEKMLDLIVLRIEIARKIAKVKKRRSLPVYDAKREIEILQALVQKSEKRGVKPLFAKKFYRLLLQYSRGEMRKSISGIKS